GSPPDLCLEHPEVLQFLKKAECHFINGTERVRYVERLIYNREQFAHYDSDVGHYVGDTPYGEKQARYWNSKRQLLEYKRAQVDHYCRHNYELDAPFSVERRVLPSPSQSLP
ncbi:2B1A protein, partial [Pomatostomus ruficeps]|nr:2B1A protein [Pomatostomus ruficeps]